MLTVCWGSELSGSVWGNTGGTVWDCPGPSGSVWSCLGLSGTVWGWVELSAGVLGLSGVVWGCRLGMPPGVVWGLVWASGSVWVCLGLSGAGWGCVGSFGIVRGCLLPRGPRGAFCANKEPILRLVRTSTTAAAAAALHMCATGRMMGTIRYLTHQRAK